MLVHMADEEERLMPALWEAFDDGALLALHQAIVASVTPAEQLALLPFLLPALNAPERAELVAGVRATAPPQAFDGLQALARRVLSPADWERLEQALAA